MPEKQRQAPRCPSCERLVRSGIKCAGTFCPFEKTVNRDGIPVIARPLKRHWQF